MLSKSPIGDTFLLVQISEGNRYEQCLPAEISAFRLAGECSTSKKKVCGRLLSVKHLFPDEEPISTNIDLASGVFPDSLFYTR